MRLVRGSILSSEACSTSKAARILRRFLCSDGGTDVSIKSFLKNAAHSLESMGEGAHSSLNKSKRKKQRFETDAATDFENPNEGLSGSGQEPQTQAGAFKTTVLEDRKHIKKSEKFSKHSVENHPNDKEEAGVTWQKSEVNKHAKKSKKKDSLEEEDAGRSENVDFDLYVTLTAQKKFENVPRANGFRADVGILTSGALNQSSIEISGQAEKKKRKKDKEHQLNKNHDGVLRNLREKTDLELEETHGTHKKSRRPRSPDRLDEDNSNNILVLSSSRKSEQGRHPVNKGDDDRNRKVAETVDEEKQSHFIKKKKKDKTPNLELWYYRVLIPLIGHLKNAQVAVDSLSIRYEWQHRGSAHVHGFLWLDRAPAMETIDWKDKQIVKDFVDYINNYVSAWNPRGIAERSSMFHHSILDDPCLLDTERILAVNSSMDYAVLFNRVQRHTKCTKDMCLAKKGTSYSCRYKAPWDLQAVSTEITGLFITCNLVGFGLSGMVTEKS